MSRLWSAVVILMNSAAVGLAVDAGRYGIAAGGAMLGVFAIAIAVTDD